MMILIYGVEERMERKRVDTGLYSSSLQTADSSFMLSLLVVTQTAV